jgi:hypothetical protein
VTDSELKAAIRSFVDRVVEYPCDAPKWWRKMLVGIVLSFRAQRGRVRQRHHAGLRAPEPLDVWEFLRASERRTRRPIHRGQDRGNESSPVFVKGATGLDTQRAAPKLACHLIDAAEPYTEIQRIRKAA